MSKKQVQATLDGSVSKMGMSISRMSLSISSASAPQRNLFIFPDDFTNAAWVKVESSIIGGALVPSVNNVSNHLVRQNVVVPAGTFTLEVEAKPSGYSWIFLTHVAGDGTNYTAYFDVQNGVKGTSGAGATSNIVASTDGYFRCSVSGVGLSSAARNQLIYVAEANADATFAGDGTSGVLLRRARLY